MKTAEEIRERLECCQRAKEQLLNPPISTDTDGLWVTLPMATLESLNAEIATLVWVLGEGLLPKTLSESTPIFEAEAEHVAKQGHQYTRRSGKCYDAPREVGAWSWQIGGQGGVSTAVIWAKGQAVPCQCYWKRPRPSAGKGTCFTLTLWGHQRPTTLSRFVCGGNEALTKKLPGLHPQVLPRGVYFIRSIGKLHERLSLGIGDALNGSNTFHSFLPKNISRLPKC